MQADHAGPPGMWTRRHDPLFRSRAAPSVPWGNAIHAALDGRSLPRLPDAQQALEDQLVRHIGEGYYWRRHWDPPCYNHQEDGNLYLLSLGYEGSGESTQGGPRLPLAEYRGGPICLAISQCPPVWERTVVWIELWLQVSRLTGP